MRLTSSKLTLSILWIAICVVVLFEIERSISGKTPGQRLAARREQSWPLIAELEIWMRHQRASLSAKNDTAKATNDLLNRWAALIRFLDDGRVQDPDAGDRSYVTAFGTPLEERKKLLAPISQAPQLKGVRED